MNDIIEIKDQMVPYAIDAEQALLGSFMLTGDDAAARDEIVARVPVTAFFLTDHCRIYQVLVELHHAGSKIDAIIVRNALKQRGWFEEIGGSAYLAEILNAVPSAAHWPEYLETVRNRWFRRWLIGVGDTLARRAQGSMDPVKIAAEASKVLTEFTSRATNNAPPESPAADLADEIDAAIEGRRRCLSFPWPAMTDLSKALRPGSQVILCGSGGASKSLFISQAFEHWHAQKIPAALFALEESRTFTLFRILAQVSRNAGATDPEFIRENAGDVRRAFGDHAELLDSIGKRIWDAPSRVPELAEVAAWVRQRAEAGDRVIVVDPVTRARTSRERHRDDDDFTGSVSDTARRFGCSVVLITHPTKGPKVGKPSLDDIAGGAAYARFAQVALYLAAHEPPKAVRCLDWVMGMPFDARCNREVVILKSRSGSGTGKRVGFEFRSSSLTFHESGVVMRNSTRQPEEETADE